MIERYIDIAKELSPGKVLVIYGPRRSGKTTLLNDFISTTKSKVAVFQGDKLNVQNDLSIYSSEHLASLIGDAQVVVIDEAQDVPNIGKSLKVMVDSMPRLKVVVTGSSAFELSGQIGEPLTGRKKSRFLYPISARELYGTHTSPVHTAKEDLPSRMVYGWYPNAITATSKKEAEEFLTELVDSYLLRDVLAFREVKSSSLLLRLLSMISYQIGQLVSLSELAGSLEIDKGTVSRYLDLLEKAFIIYRVGGYSRNLRNEITKKAKYYFYDIGVRNAVVSNFNPIDMRDDVGQLWENYLFTERLKRRSYYGPHANQYFWRTWKGEEIDLIEERGGKLNGYEFKWGSKSPRPPQAFVQTYKGETSFEAVNRANFYGFIARGQE